MVSPPILFAELSTQRKIKDKRRLLIRLHQMTSTKKTINRIYSRRLYIIMQLSANYVGLGGR